MVCVLLKHRNQTNLTDISLLNLALADLLFVLSLPLLAHYAATAEWIFGDFMCRLVSGLYTIGFYCSIFFMIVMTLDRYMVIVHSQTSARHRTVRMGIALSLFVWLLSLFVSMPTLVFTQAKQENESVKCDHYYTKGSLWKEFNFLEINVLGFLFPLLVMVACYSRIIPTLVGIKSTKKHRAVKLIIIIVAVFFCFWMPYNIVVFLLFLQSQKLYTTGCEGQGSMSMAIQVTESIAYSHCCLNPIIYAFVGQKFMQRVFRMLRKWVPSCFPAFSRDLSDSSIRRSSVKSTSTVIM